MDKPRRFKLRKGVIVEEWDGGDDFTTHADNGYINTYKIIDRVGIKDEGYENGSMLCLLVTGYVLPVGGAHGPDFDIIEEVPVV